MAGKIDPFESYLTCHRCSKILRDPVSLGCYHSFCSSCLQKFWEQAENKNCPLCKRKSSKDNIQVNLSLKELADYFAEKQKCGSFGTDTVKKVDVVCEKHPEEAKLFCKEENRAICSVCEESQPLHQSHRVVPIEQAASDLKDQLKLDLKSLHDKKDKYTQVEKTYDEMLKYSKKQKASTDKQIRAEFIKLHHFLKKEEESRLAALREEEEQKGRTIREEMRKIEGQISSLSESISAVEEDLQKPTMSFLSSYEPTRGQSLLADPQLISGALIDVAKHLGNLCFTVWKKMKDKVHFSPVTLDPNTANPFLHLSDDLTSVTRELTDQQLPDNPERFSEYRTVLGSVGFSSGEHSWEVEVGSHPSWIVGLAKESVERKGQVLPTTRCGFWCLWHRNGEYTDVDGQTVSVKKNPQKIRVHLDCDGGEVSFYDPEDMSQICSNRCTSTEKLIPYFGIANAGNTKTTAKTADIKICQTEISLCLSGKR